MNIKLNENCSLDLPGVYLIRNIKNNMFYVGSSTMRVLKRLHHHYLLLKAKKHKNSYLQNAWNKYGEENFIFEVILNTEKENCLQEEQKVIDIYKNSNVLYNINYLASGTPSMTRESIEKRRNTMKKKYASGELISTFKGKIPWNKGLTKENFDYSYLKGKKMTCTDKFWESVRRRTEREREEKHPEIYMYTEKLKFLGKFRSAKDIEDLSLQGKFKEFVGGRFKVGRKSKPVYYLCSGKITQSAVNRKSYKGLYFTFKPLHQEIDVEKLGKIEEPCDGNIETAKAIVVVTHRE